MSSLGIPNPKTFLQIFGMKMNIVWMVQKTLHKELKMY